jgi:acyl-coenzyme A synthetase/AMP-(fatty) acid ligase
VPHLNLNDYLRERARERPGKTAFLTPSRHWTFAEVDEASNRVAQGLKSLGVGHGDRVAALTKHTAQCVVLIMAATKLRRRLHAGQLAPGRARDRLRRRQRRGPLPDDRRDVPQAGPGFAQGQRDPARAH